MTKKSGKGLGRLFRAFGWSRAGLREAFVHEAAFRQELLLCAVLLPLALYFGQSGVEKGLLAGSVLLVLVVELLNSAVEATVDRIGPEEHELARRAKDMGSAAVFVSLLLLAAVWFLVLFF